MSDRKSTDSAKIRRKKLHSLRKGFTHKNEEEEGKAHGSGAF